MEENLNINVNEAENEVGNITISDEVISVIAGVATSEVKGVSSMSGTIAGGIAEAFYGTTGMHDKRLLRRYIKDNRLFTLIMK